MHAFDVSLKGIIQSELRIAFWTLMILLFEVNRFNMSLEFAALFSFIFTF
jgi:hypothetical protein